MFWILLNLRSRYLNLQILSRILLTLMAIASISMLRHHTAALAATSSFPVFGNVIRRVFNFRCFSIVAKQHNPNNVSNKPPPSKNLLRAKHTFKDYSSLAPVLSPQDNPPLSESQAIGTVAAAQANFMRVIVQTLPSQFSESSYDDLERSGSLENDSSESSMLGVELLCVVKAVLKKIKRRVLVGDKVVVGSIDWVDRRGMIENVFQRKSEILDPPVANVDHLLVLFSMDQPRLEPFTLTRFLVEAESTGIPLTLGLNKLELVDEEVAFSTFYLLNSSIIIFNAYTISDFFCIICQYFSIRGVITDVAKCYALMIL